MKVVINSCYGGFGISNEALLWLIKKKSALVKKTLWKKWCNDIEETKRELRAFKEGFKEFDRYGGVLADEKHVYSIDDHEDKVRSHTDLVKVVKELEEKAFGEHAKLEIVKIPDGVDFTIEEYDGIERIAEKHRTWS